MSIYIYQNRYSHLNIFKHQSIQFITWLCPLLKPEYYEKKEVIYTNKDHAQSVFFLKSGEAGYVLLKYDKQQYISITPGNHFGVVDILASCEKHQIPLDSWQKHMSHMRRYFSIEAVTDCEIFALAINYLVEMKT